MRETLPITDPKAASVFASPRQRRILLSLIEDERSLGQLAERTEVPLNLLHHHIRKFIRLGLVNLAREQTRAGAPIKYYRATARAFFVPAELSDAKGNTALTTRLRELLERNRAAAHQGTLYSHDGKGPRMRMVREPSHRASATEYWLDLQLTETEAKALADELHALLQRFEAASATSTRRARRRYLIHGAIAGA